MTREEIREEIKTIEIRIFLNNMVDRWDEFNYRLDTELNEKVKHLKKMLDN